MFEVGIESQPPSVDDVHAMAAALTRVGEGLDDPARIDMLRALEVLACAARGAQAAITADFDRSQRAEQTQAGVPAERLGQGIAAQVALARRESPHRGQIHVGLAKVLAEEMPHTRVALATVGSPSGRPPCWPGRPPACPVPTAPRSTGGSPATSTPWRQWATGSSTDGPEPWPMSSTRSRRWSGAAGPRPTGGSRCARHRTRWPS